MNLLMVGGDTKGAWQMRGVQLGRALGARVTACPTARDWRWADLVVLVKRAAIQWRAHVRRFKGPVVWDVLDVWDQPDANTQPMDLMVLHVEQAAAAANVDLVIGATRQMASDLGGVYLSHHSRRRLHATPPRSRARLVGYDGKTKYLGRWLRALETSCEALGLRFVVNPSDLSQVDVLVSFRDGPWDGDVCRRWKSGVKFVNAIVAGKPIVSQSSSARSELLPVGVVVDEMDGLTEALSRATGQAMREEAFESGRARAGSFQVGAIARQYRAILRTVQRRAA